MTFTRTFSTWKPAAAARAAIILEASGRQDPRNDVTVCLGIRWRFLGVAKHSGNRCDNLLLFSGDGAVLDLNANKIPTLRLVYHHFISPAVQPDFNFFRYQTKLDMGSGQIPRRNDLQKRRSYLSHGPNVPFRKTSFAYTNVQSIARLQRDIYYMERG